MITLITLYLFPENANALIMYLAIIALTILLFSKDYIVKFLRENTLPVTLFIQEILFFSIVVVFIIPLGLPVLIISFLCKLFIGKRITIRSGKLIAYKRFKYYRYLPDSSSWMRNENIGYYGRVVEYCGIFALIQQSWFKTQKVVFLNDSFDSLGLKKGEIIPDFYCQRYFLYKNRLYFKKIIPSTSGPSFIKRKKEFDFFRTVKEYFLFFIFIIVFFSVSLFFRIKDWVCEYLDPRIPDIDIGGDIDIKI